VPHSRSNNYAITRKGLGFLAIALLTSLFLLAQQNSSTAIPLSIIVVASESEAKGVLARLEKGGDFNAIARAESLDPSASENGMLGLLEPSKLRPELRSALDGLKPGQVSAIVKIPLGYAILKRLATSPMAPTSDPSPTKVQAISGAGAVRLTYDYAGFAAALQSVKRFEKPPGWDRDLRAACEVRAFGGTLEQSDAETVICAPRARCAPRRFHRR
jgi:parvulin-like peptidyl-prolyl isomerase